MDGHTSFYKNSANERGGNNGLGSDLRLALTLAIKKITVNESFPATVDMQISETCQI